MFNNNNGGNNQQCHSNARQTTAAAQHPGYCLVGETGTSVVVYATQCVSPYSYCVTDVDTFTWQSDWHIRKPPEKT